MEIDLQKIQDAQTELAKLEELKKLTGSPQEESFIEVGKTYFVRTVTYHYLIQVKAKNGKEVKGRASWIPDSGRYADFINEGKIEGSAEVEPIEPDLILRLDTIVDYCEWTHQFLDKQI